MNLGHHSGGGAPGADIDDAASTSLAQLNPVSKVRTEGCSGERCGNQRCAAGAAGGADPRIARVPFVPTHRRAVPSTPLGSTSAPTSVRLLVTGRDSPAMAIAARSAPGTVRRTASVQISGNALVVAATQTACDDGARSDGAQRDADTQRRWPEHETVRESTPRLPDRCPISPCELHQGSARRDFCL